MTTDSLAQDRDFALAEVERLYGWVDSLGADLRRKDDLLALAGIETEMARRELQDIEADAWRRWRPRLLAVFAGGVATGAVLTAVLF